MKLPQVAPPYIIVTTPHLVVLLNCGNCIELHRGLKSLVIKSYIASLQHAVDGRFLLLIFRFPRGCFGSNILIMGIELTREAKLVFKINLQK